MKSRSQKRTEALARLKRARYEFSKAKRKGIPEEEWRAARDKLIEQLENTR